MELVGKIIQILPLQGGTSTRTGNPWSVQSFILETQEQYPRKVCVELFGEERIKANPLVLDEIVTVNFDIESREFNGRWYTSVRAWRVQAGAVPQATAQPAQPVSTPAAAATPTASQAATTGSFDAVAANSADDNSDLPF